LLSYMYELKLQNWLQK